jgi:hypothetical protein
MVSPQEREFRKKLKELREPRQERRLCRTEISEGRARCTTARRHRSISASLPDQAKELHEEGIEFHPLPVLPDERN